MSATQPDVTHSLISATWCYLLTDFCSNVCGSNDFKECLFSLEQPLTVPMSMCWKWRPTRNRCVTYWKNMTLLPLLAARLAVIKNLMICISFKKWRVIRQMSSSTILQQVRHIPWQTYNALISYAHKCLANSVPAQNVFLWGQHLLTLSEQQ